MFGNQINISHGGGSQGIVGIAGFAGCTSPSFANKFKVLIAYKQDNGSVQFISLNNRPVVVEIDGCDEKSLSALSHDVLSLRNFRETNDFITLKKILEEQQKDLYTKYSFDQSLEMPWPPHTLKDNMKNPRDPWYFDRQTGTKYMQFFSNFRQIAERQPKQYSNEEEKHCHETIKNLMAQKDELQEIMKIAKTVSTSHFANQLVEINKELEGWPEKLARYAELREEHDIKEADYSMFLTRFSQQIAGEIAKSGPGLSISPSNVCIFYC